MNILELCFSTAWGELEIYVNTFVNEFTLRNNNLISFVRASSKLEDEFKKNTIQYISVNPKLKYLDFITALEIKTKLSKYKIDIIHVHESKDLSTAIILKILLKYPKIVFSQKMDSRYNKKDLFHRWIYNNLDQVVCMTDNMRLNHLAHAPVKEFQISTIYNGIDLERFGTNNFSNVETSFIDTLALNKSIIIGTIARLDRLKNQELLIDAALILIKKMKCLVHFLIIGDETHSVTGKDYRKKLLEKVYKENLSNYFTFLGFTENIEQYFQFIDIFVLPTDKESFGYVLIEAMAAGKPVIASDLGGPKEIIEVNTNGYLFKSRNAIDLAEKISLLINNKELRIKMGIESKNIASAKFNIKGTIDKYLKLFENLVIN